jgi:hypothetical protein
MKKAIRKANWEVSTFELFLLNIDRIKDGTTVFLDEIQLFPPGKNNEELLAPASSGTDHTGVGMFGGQHHRLL